MILKSFTVGDETFNYTDRQLILPAATAQRMADLLEEWAKVSPFEPTYTMRNYGVPSLIVRFDGVLDESGAFQSYEIQSGGAWVGYAGLANESFREVRDTFVQTVWPKFKLLMPPATRNDDEMWIERITLEEAQRDSCPLMIRRWLFHELSPEKRMPLIERSVKPMIYINDKQYGLRLGWWRQVMWNGSDDAGLPWEEAFVLKPRRSNGSVDVMIWRPGDRRGRATRTQILNTFRKRNLMYLQPFIPPMHMDIEGKPYNMMYRPFFGYDPHAKKWIPMHGVWTARPYPNLRLHGASDTISGPLLVR